MTTREWYAADADDQDRTRSDTTVWRDRGTIIAAQQARISELETLKPRLDALTRWLVAEGHMTPVGARQIAKTVGEVLP